MPRLALKPDSSFYRKVAIGAVGARAVADDLARHGHRLVELERGSLDTKLWKEVKRKRVRIPDLVCERCGQRAESRAKTSVDLSMSHSSGDEARAWDFGMVDSDWIAFPIICVAGEEDYWSAGRLHGGSSYWHERNWVQWSVEGHVNYFTAGSFRATPPARSAVKGVTEGSETSIAWAATFSTRDGRVESVNDRRIAVRRSSDGHCYTWNTHPDHAIAVRAGDVVRVNQALSSSVAPVSSELLRCPEVLPDGHISHLLSSRERTQRFTGVKLARLSRLAEFRGQIADLAADEEEDVYVRLESAAYLTSVAGLPAVELFAPYLRGPDPQTQLEGVISLGEAGTSEAVELLSAVMDAEEQPYFLRSAAAWCLGRIGDDDSVTRLIRAFQDVDVSLREEALEGVVSVGQRALPRLLAGLTIQEQDVAAGCAEALRQHQPLTEATLARLAEHLHSPDPPLWTVWLLGTLPRNNLAPIIAELQSSSPQLHFALNLLWAFSESWISRYWEVCTGPRAIGTFQE